MIETFNMGVTLAGHYNFLAGGASIIAELDVYKRRVLAARVLNKSISFTSNLLAYQLKRLYIV